MIRCYIHKVERPGDAFALCFFSYCQGAARCLS